MSDIVNEISTLSNKISMLRNELAEMKNLLLKVVAPAVSLSVREEADIIRAAVKEGSQAAMIKARKTINGE